MTNDIQPPSDPPVRASELVRDSEPRYSKMELIRAVNACCTCGGGGPVEKHTCPACEVYHALATGPNAEPREEVLEQLKASALKKTMWGVAERMEYFGGFKGEMRQHAHELAGAATIARGWAKSIRAKRANDAS